MSNKNKNNNVTEEAKVTNEVTNQVEQNDGVPIPPVPTEVKAEEPKKGFFQKVGETVGKVVNPDPVEHPTAAKVMGGVKTVGKVAVIAGVASVATVGMLAFAGNKKQSEDEDQDDQYDDYDDDQEDDEDDAVADVEAKEIDE